MYMFIVLIEVKTVGVLISTSSKGQNREKSLMAYWLEKASQWHEVYCHDLEVFSSNPDWDKLGSNLGCVVLLFQVVLELNINSWTLLIHLHFPRLTIFDCSTCSTTLDQHIVLSISILSSSCSWLIDVADADGWCIHWSFEMCYN